MASSSRGTMILFLRSRFAGGVVVGVGATLTLLAAGAGWAWSLASATECADMPREDLSLREMGELRHLVEKYKSDPTEPMELTSRQASFLLREEFELPAWLAAEGGGVHGEARLQEEGRCWNVSFHGTVEVADGRARVVPTDLRIGDLPLGWLVRGHPFDLGPDAVDREPRASELLGHLDLVQVRDDRFVVKVDDPRWMR